MMGANPELDDLFDVAHRACAVQPIVVAQIRNAAGGICSSASAVTGRAMRLEQRLATAAGESHQRRLGW